LAAEPIGTAMLGNPIELYPPRIDGSGRVERTNVGSETLKTGLLIGGAKFV
jgi:hypothetical protein